MTPVRLPTHPRTGLTALGFRRNGAPIWPVAGASPDGDPADPAPTPPADPPKPPDGTPPADPPQPKDGPLGETGKKALEAERAARQALEKQLAPLKPLLDALGGKPGPDAKTDLERLTERFGEYEQQVQEERLARFRAEVASEKGLTPAQARRLVGTTREGLAADADQILLDFPTTPARTPAPKPDPSQGPKGDPPAARPTSLGTAVAARMNKA